MLSRNRNSRRTSILNCFAVAAAIVFNCSALNGQTASPSPSPVPEVMLGDYLVTSAIEVGYRWRSVDGNFNKYQSDLNYKSGFRSFDSSFFLQAPEGRQGRYFDSLLVTNSGWGSDPSGATRVHLEKVGAYKFDSNVRQVTYFNNLFNFANPINLPNSEHSQNTKHTFGDFDLIAFPQDERLRIIAGVSFNKLNGDGMSTERFFSDEYPINSRIRGGSVDFRFGGEGKLWGFDWGLMQGYRDYNDRSSFFLLAPSQGNTTTNQSRLDTLLKSGPLDGKVHYTTFNLHRTFAERLDFTARAIYSSSSSESATQMNMTGRDNTNPNGILVTSDIIDVVAEAKRPQTRADLGITYLVTNKFRISNTFTFDQFAVNGSETFREAWIKANGARSVVNSSGYRVNAYKRYMNTIEGDYQFNNRLAFHLGYRYTHRSIDNTGFDRSSSCVSTTNPPCPPAPPVQSVTLINESEENSTHAVIAGMKIKPRKNWVLWWDIEHGDADNVFTRLENYSYTNFRFRNKFTVNHFSLNLSAVSKDNENPSDPKAGVIVPANVSFITNIKNRFYSGSLDWDAHSNLFISTGYTYRHLTSYTPIVIPISGAPGPPPGYAFGFSQFFIRDHYFFFDVTAHPTRRLSLYGSYRFDRDRGQGDRITAPVATVANPNIIGSYPIRFVMPEFRAAFMLTRRIDWNFGYQYYNYHDTQTPFQNYRAHLPYTSIRFYIGRGEAR